MNTGSSDEPFTNPRNLQDKLFPKPDPGLEIVEGDVFQFSSLPAALDDADTIVVATGASDRFDPLGPFNVDYQVRRRASCLT